MNPTYADAPLLARAEHVGRLLAESVPDLASGRVSRRLVGGLAEHGLLAHLFDGGGPAVDLCLIRQGLARACTAAETAFALQGLGGHPIATSAQPDVSVRWVPSIAAGTAVAGFALTEPGAGSDAANIALVAERDGDGFRLTGAKAYISNAPDADVYTVFARTTPGAGARGVTAFVVAGDAAGLSGAPLELISPHPVGTLEFDGVAVGAGDVLGDIDAGFRVAMRTLDLFRPSVGAFAVGMGEAALQAAVDHASERQAFGRPIAEFQAVSHQLAEMATRLEAARLLVYRAAEAYDRGERASGPAAMAKLYATETAQFVIDAAIQVHGARALEHDHLLAHLYRDVRATRIYEGTSEIQRNVIARELLAGRLGARTPGAAAT
jgi:alkylation response protein AidB-like acyl-CoA dehydrogenase